MLNFWLAKETEIFHDVFHLEYHGRPSNRDMAEDGYHPSEAACEDFAKIIVNALAFDWDELKLESKSNFLRVDKLVQTGFDKRRSQKFSRLTRF